MRSKPTSSTTFPDLSMALLLGSDLPLAASGGGEAVSFVSSAAYLKRKASRKDLCGSGILDGRMKDPAVGDEDKQSKYRLPWCVPSCFPRLTSSHSTPSQTPFVLGRDPWYLTVHKAPS